MSLPTITNTVLLELKLLRHDKYSIRILSTLSPITVRPVCYRSRAGSDSQAFVVKCLVNVITAFVILDYLAFDFHSHEL